MSDPSNRHAGFLIGGADLTAAPREQFLRLPDTVIGIAAGVTCKWRIKRSTTWPGSSGRTFDEIANIRTPQRAADCCFYRKIRIPDNSAVIRSQKPRQFREIRVGTMHALRVCRECLDQGDWNMKIEKASQRGRTTVWLSGHFQAEHIAELNNQLQDNGSRFVLDLTEVTVVDVEVVRFFGASEANGVKIVHCPRYIREWINRERKP